MVLDVRRVFEESLPIAAILVVWSLLAGIAWNGSVGFAILLGGLIMATLYSLVRGLALAADAEPAYREPDVESVLRENGRALLAGGPWFLAGIVLTLVLDLLDPVGFPGMYSGSLLWRVLTALIQGLALTGTLTVLLVAVASGTHVLRRDR